MNTDYSDIRGLIGGQPVWFDEHAVPRYCEFLPTMCANLYADEAALVLISCQSCRRKFWVAMTSQRDMTRVSLQHALAQEILSCTLEYGDPPNVGCCKPGPSMNSIPHRVLQYWRRSHSGRWWPEPRLALAIIPTWAVDLVGVDG